MISRLNVIDCKCDIIDARFTYVVNDSFRMYAEIVHTIKHMAISKKWEDMGSFERKNNKYENPIRKLLSEIITGDTFAY